MNDGECIHLRQPEPCSHPKPKPSCAWCIVEEQGAELVKLRAAMAADSVSELPAESDATAYNEQRTGHATVPCEVKQSMSAYRTCEEGTKGCYVEHRPPEAQVTTVELPKQPSMCGHGSYMGGLGCSYCRWRASEPWEDAWLAEQKAKQVTVNLGDYDQYDGGSGELLYRPKLAVGAAVVAAHESHMIPRKVVEVLEGGESVARLGGRFYRLDSGQVMHSSAIREADPCPTQAVTCSVFSVDDAEMPCVLPDGHTGPHRDDNGLSWGGRYLREQRTTKAVNECQHKFIDTTTGLCSHCGINLEDRSGYDSSFDRLRDIIDEVFGMQPVMGDAEALDCLERELARWQRDWDASGRILGALSVAATLKPGERLGAGYLLPEHAATDALRKLLDRIADLENPRPDYPRSAIDTEYVRLSVAMAEAINYALPRTIKDDDRFEPMRTAVEAFEAFIVSEDEPEARSETAAPAVGMNTKERGSDG